MDGRRIWLCLATAGAVACGCSKSDSPPSVQPRLLTDVHRQIDVDAAATSIMPVSLTVEPPDEKPLRASQPEVLVEPSLAATPHRTALRDLDRQSLTEAIKALRVKLSVIANNLANSQTTSFKRSRVVFEECAYQQVQLPGAEDAFNNYAPTGIAIGRGTRVQATQTIFDQGKFDITDNNLDIAIEGDGFFQVINPTTNEFLYTRAGNCSLNSNGLLVIGSAQTGRLVQPQISMPISTMGVVISAEGNVSIRQFGQTQFSQIGQIQLAKFLNPQGLLRVGENLYQETLASGAAIFGEPGTNGLGTLRQGQLELSNVDLADELQAWNETERTLRALEQLLAPGR